MFQLKFLRALSATRLIRFFSVLSYILQSIYCRIAMGKRILNYFWGLGGTSLYAESGGFFIFISSQDPSYRSCFFDVLVRKQGNGSKYERKMRAFHFTWRHFFLAIHAEIRRSECRAAIAVLCMYGVYDTEILLAPSSINFNPQPTLSGASPTLSGASRYAVRS